MDSDRPRPGDPEFEKHAKRVLSSEKGKMSKNKTKLFQELTRKSLTKKKADVLSEGFYDLVFIDEVDGVEYVRYGKDVVLVRKNCKFYANKESDPFKEFLERLSRIAESSPVTIEGQIETMTEDVRGVLPLDEEATQNATRGARRRILEKVKEGKRLPESNENGDLRDVLLQGKRGDLRDAVRHVVEKGTLSEGEGEGRSIISLVKSRTLSYEEGDEIIGVFDIDSNGLGRPVKYDVSMRIIEEEIENNEYITLQKVKKFLKENGLALAGVSIMLASFVTAVLSLVKSVARAAKSA